MLRRIPKILYVVGKICNDYIYPPRVSFIPLLSFAGIGTPAIIRVRSSDALKKCLPG